MDFVFNLLVSSPRMQPEKCLDAELGEGYCSKDVAEKMSRLITLLNVSALYSLGDYKSFHSLHVTLGNLVMFALLYYKPCSIWFFKPQKFLVLTIDI